MAVFVKKNCTSLNQINTNQNQLTWSYMHRSHCSHSTSRYASETQAFSATQTNAKLEMTPKSILHRRLREESNADWNTACNSHEQDEFVLPKVRSFSGVLSPLFVHTAAEKKLSRRAIFTTRFRKRIMPSHARLHPGRAVNVRTRTTRTPTRRELGTPLSSDRARQTRRPAVRGMDKLVQYA